MILPPPRRLRRRCARRACQSVPDMFSLGMGRIDANRVAETILAAPGWARVGITAPTSHIRVAAARELARAILAEVEGRDPPDPDHLGLSVCLLQYNLKWKYRHIGPRISRAYIG